MEGKGVLFKRFADIDVFDIEVDTHDPEEIIRFCQLLEPTFGGINLEDIKAPECFEIEETLKKTMGIPVFHDDQHGTAIISGAALLNALRARRQDARRGQGGVLRRRRRRHRLRQVLPARSASSPRTSSMVDTKGVIYKGRTEGMNPYKEQFARDTDARTLADAMRGADVFAGVSAKGMVTQEMVKTMAKDPIIFAMANPDPEITPEEVLRGPHRRHHGHRPLRLPEPGQQRARLPVHLPRRARRRRHRDQRGDEARGRARPRRPRQGGRARLGDPGLRRQAVQVRSRLHHPEAVRLPRPALGGAGGGRGRDPHRGGPDAVQLARGLRARAREPAVPHPAGDARGLRPGHGSTPSASSSPRARRTKIVRAAKILVDEGICRPVLLGERAAIERRLVEHEVPEESVEVVDPATDERAVRATPSASTRCAGARASPRSPRRRRCGIRSTSAT